jgi:hypothetical protein
MAHISNTSSPDSPPQKRSRHAISEPPSPSPLDQGDEDNDNDDEGSQALDQGGDNNLLPLQGPPQPPQLYAHTPHPPRKEAALLHPFTKAPPYQTDDYEMWALNVRLYCSSDLQAFLKEFDDPDKRPATKDENELNAFLMQLL